MTSGAKLAAAASVALLLAAGAAPAPARPVGSVGEAHPGQGGQSGGGNVSRADFQRLEGEVQDLQRRVAALEHRGGGNPRGSGKTAGDSWQNH
jgi:poly(3-hydroxybutyrate) depolymerase